MATPLFGFGLVRIPVTTRCSAAFEMRPNPAVNADAPVRTCNLANRCGGAAVTLFCWAARRRQLNI